MQILIIVLVVLGVLFALFMIIAAFTRKSYSIERSITINKPAPEVFDYVRFLRNQDHFSKWVMTDPQMKKTFTGEDGSVGFVYAWDGNKRAGKGEQEIIGIEPGKNLDVEVRFERPFKAIAYTPFRVSPAGSGQTTLTWGMRSTMKYPMNFMLLFMNIEKFLGDDLEESLKTLKYILEKK